MAVVSHILSITIACDPSSVPAGCRSLSITGRPPPAYDHPLPAACCISPAICMRVVHCPSPLFARCLLFISHCRSSISLRPISCRPLSITHRLPCVAGHVARSRCLHVLPSVTHSRHTWRIEYRVILLVVSEDVCRHDELTPISPLGGEGSARVAMQGVGEYKYNDALECRV